MFHLVIYLPHLSHNYRIRMLLCSGLLVASCSYFSGEASVLHCLSPRHTHTLCLISAHVVCSECVIGVTSTLSAASSVWFLNLYVPPFFSSSQLRQNRRVSSHLETLIAFSHLSPSCRSLPNFPSLHFVHVRPLQPRRQAGCWAK